MQAAFVDSVTVPAAAETRLRLFAALLLRWTGRINLVSRGDQPFLWERHVLDSLRLLPLLPAGLGRAIDLGSGAGFPGLVLAIASGTRFELVEADKRKAAFLREAAAATGAPVGVHCERMETSALAPAGLVTARALAPLPVLIGLAAPFLQPGGAMLFPKGARVDDELLPARRAWRFGLERLGEAGSPILRITEPERV